VKAAQMMYEVMVVDVKKDTKPQKTSKIN
jgi:hypothetical protein